MERMIRQIRDSDILILAVQVGHRRRIYR